MVMREIYGAHEGRENERPRPWAVDFESPASTNFKHSRLSVDKKLKNYKSSLF